LSLGSSRFMKGLRCSSKWPLQAAIGVAVIAAACVGVYWLLPALRVQPPAARLLTMVGLTLGAILSGALYRVNRLFDRRFMRIGSLARVRAAQPVRVLSDRRAKAQGVRVGTFAELWVVLQQLGIVACRPVLVAAGGADAGDGAGDLVTRLLRQVVFPLAREVDGVIIDAGTDVGLASLLGRVRAQSWRVDLIGVTPVGAISFPGNTRARADAGALQPQHTHFILVPGGDWAPQAEWMAEAAAAVADGESVVTLVVGGGDMALRDAAESVRRQRPVIAMRGSGGAADRLALHGARGAEDSALADIVNSGLLHCVDVDTDPRTLRELIHRLWIPEDFDASSSPVAAFPAGGTQSAPAATAGAEPELVEEAVGSRAT